MKMEIVLLVVCFFVCNFVRGQNTFQKTMGAHDAAEIKQTSDRGFILCGETFSFGSGNADVYVLKLDSNGNHQWSRAIGGSDWDWGSSVIQANDGSYVVCGVTRSFGAGSDDFYIIKLDNDGTIQWTKTVGGVGEDWGYSIVQSNDGGYVACGYSYSFGAGSRDIYVVKLDFAGNLQWTKTIGGSSDDIGYSIIQTNDLGYAIAGGFGMYVVKLDSSGNLQWTKKIGGNNDVGYSIIQTIDEGYVVCGVSIPVAINGDVYIAKMDSAGNVQWTKTIDGGADDRGFSIVQTRDTGYALCGYTSSFGAGSIDVYAIKLDSSVNIQWTITIGGTGSDYGYSIIQTNDNGYAISGEYNGGGALLIKLDRDGNTCDTSGSGGVIGNIVASLDSGGTVSSGGTISSGGVAFSAGTVTALCFTVGINEMTLRDHISLSPNPATNAFTISDLRSTILKIEMYNVLGEKVFSESQEPGIRNQAVVDVSSLSPGVYFVRLANEKEQVIRKVVVQR